MGPLQGRNACRSRRSPISGLTTLSMLDNVPYIVSFTLKTSFKNDACRQKSRDCGTRSEEHTSELQSLMRLQYADFCLNKQTTNPATTDNKRNLTISDKQQ